MAKKKFNLIIIAPPQDYEREIICDSMDWGNGAYYFYNVSEDNRRNIICYYPISNTMIDSIEDYEETKSDREEGKISNEVKKI